VCVCACRAATGSGYKRLLCHVERRQVSRRTILQQLFPVHSVTGGDQPDDRRVAVGPQRTDARTSQNSHQQIQRLRRLTEIRMQLSFFLQATITRLHIPVFKVFGSSLMLR